MEVLLPLIFWRLVGVLLLLPLDCWSLAGVLWPDRNLDVLRGELLRRPVLIRRPVRLGAVPCLPVLSADGLVSLSSCCNCFLGCGVPSNGSCSLGLSIGVFGASREEHDSADGC